MKLKSLILALVIVVVAVSSALAASPAPAKRTAIVHYFVVPDSVSVERVKELNEFLTMTAGGFSALRSNGGILGNPGKELIDDNWSYLVAADRDMSAEIQDYLKQYCRMPKVFILVWKAGRPGL